MSVDQVTQKKENQDFNKRRRGEEKPPYVI